MKLLPFLLIASPVFAQYKADVAPAKTTGYQRIDLSIEVIGRLNYRLGDLRLYGGKRREVPYLLVRQTGTNGTAFLPFTIIEKTSIAHVSTLTIKRPDKRPIRAMSLVVGNTDVQKSASLSGSPDGITWYALDNNIVLGGKSSITTTTYTETISFPLTDYPYLRLRLIDSTAANSLAAASTVVASTAAPLNIVRVGSHEQTPSSSAQYTSILGLRFRQIDSSDQHTYLFIDRPIPARIDRLSIRVSSPALFRRRAEFGQVFTQAIIRKRGQKRVERSFDSEVDFTLSSTGDTTLLLPSVLTEKLCIRIANADDPPLQISAVSAAQITTYLVANLLADSTYTLQFGDKSTAPPVYDLAYFRDKLPAVLPVATVGMVIDSNTSVLKPLQKISPYMLWAGIGAVLLFLGYMSFQMLGKVKGMNNE